MNNSVLLSLLSAVAMAQHYFPGKEVLVSKWKTSADVVCPMDMCWDGTSRDPTDCSCPEELLVCTDDLCWDGTPRNPNDCSCLEDPQPICDIPICTGNFYFDASIEPCGACVEYIDHPCDYVELCDPGYIWDGSATVCQCVRLSTCDYIKSCQDYYEWDMNEDVCDCVPKTPTVQECDIEISCRKGYYFDQADCKCLRNSDGSCDGKICKKLNTFLDEETCRCAKTSEVCDNKCLNRRFAQDKDTCECTCERKCKNKTRRLDENTCRCVKM